MTVTTYTATLFDCPVSDTDKRTAEVAFSKAVETSLGGQQQVAVAYKAYSDAFNAHGELPLPADATDAERRAVAAWEEAESAGTSAAFAGWVGDLHGAHFEITTN